MYKIALFLLFAVLAVATAQIITTGLYGSPYLRSGLGYGYGWNGLYGRTGLYGGYAGTPYAYRGLSGYYY